MDMLLELTEIELIAAIDIDGRTIAYTLIDEDYGYWQGWTEISGPVLRERTRMARMDGRQWDRVIRTLTNPREKKAQEANKNLLGSDMFISALILLADRLVNQEDIEMWADRLANDVAQLTD